MNLPALIRRTAADNAATLARWIDAALTRGDGAAVVKLVLLRARWVAKLGQPKE